MLVELEGRIEKPIFIETYFSKFTPINGFKKHRFIVKSNEENLVLEINEKKIELLKYCNHNQLITFFCELKVSSKLHYGKTLYINELIFIKLKVIKTIYNSEQPILFENSKYIINFNTINNLYLCLINIDNNQTIELCHKHDLPDISIGKTHVFIKEEIGIELLEIFYKKGILSKGFFLRTKEGNSGYICEVLVLPPLT